METESNTHLTMLIQSLQLLAASYEQQVNALPAFVDIPDEVALTFSETLLLAGPLVKRGWIRLDQKVALEQLNALLEQMSDTKDLWTLASLQASPQWEKVRDLAENILNSFQILRQAPDLYWMRYVSG